jgi:hypothetical protein
MAITVVAATLGTTTDGIPPGGTAPIIPGMTTAGAGMIPGTTAHGMAAGMTPGGIPAGAGADTIAHGIIVRGPITDGMAVAMAATTVAEAIPIATEPRITVASLGQVLVAR